MYKTLNQVLVSPVNNSKSKEAHRFGQQSRFPKTKQSYCQKSAYDLSCTDLVRSSQMLRSVSKFARQSRFKRQQTELMRRSLSPSPNSYNLHSFTDKVNRNINKTNFNREQKLKLKNNDVPGPGRYQNSAHNPQVQLSYTMRNKTKTNNTHWNQVGPGQYNVDESNRYLTKYALGRINKDSRFKNSANGVPAPGTYRNVEQLGRQISTKYTKTPKHSFGRDVRGRRLKTQAPGPGQYDHFTEFSCNDRDIFEKTLSHLL